MIMSSILLNSFLRLGYSGGIDSVMEGYLGRYSTVQYLDTIDTIDRQAQVEKHISVQSTWPSKEVSKYSSKRVFHVFWTKLTKHILRNIFYIRIKKKLEYLACIRVARCTCFNKQNQVREKLFFCCNAQIQQKFYFCCKSLTCILPSQSSSLFLEANLQCCCGKCSRYQARLRSNRPPAADFRNDGNFGLKRQLFRN